MPNPLEVGLYSVVCDREKHIGRAERETLVPVLHRNYFFKSPMYMAFPTAADHADRAVGPFSPLPCQGWHGYGVYNAHHGEVRGCRRPTSAPPCGAAAVAPPAGATSVYTCTRTPFNTFSPERPMARYATTSLHGRFPFLGQLVPRRIAPSPTRRSLTHPPRPPAQPQERRVDAHASGRPLGLNGRTTARHVPAPPAKLLQLAQHASSLLGRTASNARWLPTRQLVAFAGKAQFLYLAIAPARFFLREMHNVLATRSG
jgi:hypothetical protein